ncbi:MAG TPA: glycosyltransferase, partial [Ktedonobacterales bacterium]|nr:glycosyltransferase [Ktedonobacterales bacterium]
WLFPTRSVGLLLLENSLAYSFGAVNSFLFNKYWTFRCLGRVEGREVGRFTLTTLAGVACNTLLLWLLSTLLHPVFLNAVLWANASKIVAIGGTVLISYLGMRLWVFASAAQPAGRAPTAPAPSLADQIEQLLLDQPGNHEQEACPGPTTCKGQDDPMQASLSVILPAHNEELVIARTVKDCIRFLTPRVPDLEVLVVNDGSTDMTPVILEELALAYPCLRVINHPINQGYGAALVSGFEAATKDVIFFMDSDGQFDIHDLQPFFPLLDYYDAVLGYRLARQDTPMRKLNAWGWKLLIRAVLGVRIRDIDCAFKLFRADFFREYRLETRGAMINTEILYKWTKAGYTYTEMGVRHLPRRGGRATGAKPSVILRAFKELAISAWKWRFAAARRTHTKSIARR